MNRIDEILEELAHHSDVTITYVDPDASWKVSNLKEGKGTEFSGKGESAIIIIDLKED